MGTLQIRNTTEHDVEAVKALFVDAYGPDYPFTDFYDAGWLKKAVYDDDTMFLVAELDGKVLGTVSVMFATGGLSDLIGEFGRLVVHHEARGHDAGTQLLQAALERTSNLVGFAYAKARTAHIGSQKILEASGFHAVGFEPLKYKLEERESVVLYAGHPAGVEDLRRNNPHVIPEIAPLAMHVLKQAGIDPDVIVAEADGYPTPRPRGSGSRRFQIEDLSERGWSPLLRIERGRVELREIFGNLSLSHGFFKIRAQDTRYLVARYGASVLGGLGFSHDPIDQKVRIFELIGFDETVKGALLDEVDRLAQEELEATYIEADVSAYAPDLQRTLERLGFMATAYCPSMVFSDVERLDVVRMAKLTAPYFREEIPLTDAAVAVRDIVEFSMLDRREGRRVFRAARKTSIFNGIDEGDTYHLARIGRMREVAAGERLISKGETGDRVFVLVSGELRVSRDSHELGRIRAGETVGEMALLDERPRSADVDAVGAARVMEVLHTDLQELMARRPRLGMALMRNLAVNLSTKLRDS